MTVEPSTAFELVVIDDSRFCSSTLDEVLTMPFIEVVTGPFPELFAKL